MNNLFKGSNHTNTMVPNQKRSTSVNLLYEWVKINLNKKQYKIFSKFGYPPYLFICPNILISHSGAHDILSMHRRLHHDQGDNLFIMTSSISPLGHFHLGSIFGSLMYVWAFRSFFFNFYLCNWLSCLEKYYVVVSIGIYVGIIIYSLAHFHSPH